MCRCQVAPIFPHVPARASHPRLVDGKGKRKSTVDSILRSFAPVLRRARTRRLMITPADELADMANRQRRGVPTQTNRGRVDAHAAALPGRAPQQFHPLLRRGGDPPRAERKRGRVELGVSSDRLEVSRRPADRWQYRALRAQPDRAALPVLQRQANRTNLVSSIPWR